MSNPPAGRSTLPLGLDGAEPAHGAVTSGHHTWAQLLALVGAVRRLAHDRTLSPSEALGRIRDAFHDYEGGRGGN
jgi:hypothetical protein